MVTKTPPSKRSRSMALSFCSSLTMTGMMADSVLPRLNPSARRFSTMTWSADRNRAQAQRAAGHALLLKLRNNTVSQSWQYESAIATFDQAGKAASRVFT